VLLRGLAGYHAWLVQLGDDRWVVSGRADTETDGQDVEGIVREWAFDRGRHLEPARTLLHASLETETRRP
jgi:hypothetical protein